MKRLILPLTLLLTLFATAPLFAVDSSQRPTVVQDVVRLTAAGVPDSSIIAFVQNRRGTYTVSADDMIVMTDAKVSKEVMNFVASAAATDDQSWRNGNRAVEERADETRTNRDSSTTVVVPAPRIYYDPWYYWDPWWYRPTLSLNFGFGGYYGGYYRGYYPRGGWYGGHGGFHGRPGGGIHRGGRH